MKNKNDNLIERPPAVVVMGHIDSGKTTLLDQIRKSQIAEGESGGITQHIGAYQVEKEGKKITFIDTPGHEAFFQMRSRGAKIADVAILVIDSCKGVQKQTKEVISHIKDVDIPPIVALNKIDKTTAFPQKAKKQLQKEGITVESMGGDIPSVKVSAKTGKGIEDLLDLIILVSDMQELKADPTEAASGVIIESYLDNKRGATATLLLRSGTLNTGDIIATPSSWGRIKVLEDFQGNQLEKVLPGDPAVVLGLENVPQVGEKIKQFSNLEEAKDYSQSREEKIGIEAKEVELEPGQKLLNIILKTDVLGSIEAIERVIKNLPQEKIVLRLIKAEVGDISQNDIKLAQSSNSLVVGFRVDINTAAERLLQRKENKVKVMTFDIIYELIEGIRKTMEKMLEPEVVRTNIGKMKVLKTFWSKKNRQIIGGRITKGKVKKGLLVEVIRGEEVLDRGKLVELQKKKQPIRQASQGEEVGILYEGKEKIQKGDTIIFYQKKRRKGIL